MSLGFETSGNRRMDSHCSDDEYLQHSDALWFVGVVAKNHRPEGTQDVEAGVEPGGQVVIGEGEGFAVYGKA